MIYEVQRKLIINDFYKNSSYDEKTAKLYVRLIGVKLIISIVILMYLSYNIIFTTVVNIILITILFLSIVYVIISIMNIRLHKNYLDFASIRCINILKLINVYSTMSVTKFNAVWDIELQGYTVGKYRINNIDEKSFKRIRKINQTYFGILKNNDILLLNQETEILVGGKKFFLIDYLKSQKIKIMQEVIEEELSIQDIKTKIKTKIKINKLNLGIYTIIYYCDKLSYFVIWISICKMLIF